MSLAGKSRDLRTESLLLRAMVIEDTAAMYEIYSDEETMRYWACAPLEDLAAAEKFVREDIDWAERGEAINWTITVGDTDRAIGKCILLRYSESNRRAEVGYILHRDFWRKGLMFEAMSAVVDFAFNELGLHRLEADTDPCNAGSLGLLEKLGFQREGLFRDRWQVAGEWQVSIMLGLLSTDWKAD